MRQTNVFKKFNLALDLTTSARAIKKSENDRVCKSVYSSKVPLTEQARLDCEAIKVTAFAQEEIITTRK